MVRPFSCRFLRRSARRRSCLGRGGRHHQRAIGGGQDHAYGRSGTCRLRLPHRRGVGDRLGPGLLQPYPKALTIKRGSFELLADLRPPPTDLSPHVWHVAPTDVRSDATASATPPSLVLLVTQGGSAESGEVAGMKEVTRSEALVGLFQQGSDPRTPARNCASWPTSSRDVRVSTCPLSISTVRSEASRTR